MKKIIVSLLLSQVFLGCNNQIENKDHLKSLEHTDPYRVSEMDLPEDQKIEMIKEWMIIDGKESLGLGTSVLFYGEEFSEMVSLDINSKDLDENIKKFLNNENRREHFKDSILQERAKLLARWNRKAPSEMKLTEDDRKKNSVKFLEIMKGISSKEDYKAKIPEIFAICSALGTDVNGETRRIDVYSSDEEIESYIDDLWEDYISVPIKKLQEQSNI